VETPPATTRAPEELQGTGIGVKEVCAFRKDRPARVLGLGALPGLEYYILRFHNPLNPIYSKTYFKRRASLF